MRQLGLENHCPRINVPHWIVVWILSGKWLSSWNSVSGTFRGILATGHTPEQEETDILIFATVAVRRVSSTGNCKESNDYEMMTRTGDTKGTFLFS